MKTETGKFETYYIDRKTSTAHKVSLVFGNTTYIYSIIACKTSNSYTQFYIIIRACMGNSYPFTVIRKILSLLLKWL